jgi:hypothetical protein
MTAFGLRFGCSSTWWKPYQLYFRMDPDSYLHLLRGACNHWFTTEIFCIHDAVSRDFGPMGRVSSGAQ